MINKILEKSLQEFQAKLNTCIPGRIESYDSKRQAVDVQPLLNRRLISGQHEILPIIPNVPFCFPSAGDRGLFFPIKRGDNCLLLFSQRSIETWKISGGRVTPNDTRKHAFSDAIAIPGLKPFANDFFIGNPNKTQITQNRSELSIDNSGRIALGRQGAELLDLFDQLLDALSSAVTATGIGPQPLSAVPQFTAIKLLLAQIKGNVG